jgi:hypothetical protein
VPLPKLRWQKSYGVDIWKGASVTDDQPVSPPAAVKKAWESPQIQSGQLFESNSLPCAKAQRDDPDLSQGKIQNS